MSLAKAINSPKLDFSPVYFQNGVVFVSNRMPEGAMKKGLNDKDLWTGDDYNTHYFALEKADGNLAQPELFSLGLDGKFHEGPLTFSKSGDQVFFTRNISKKKKNKEFNLKIYTAFNYGSAFENPKLIDFGDATSNDAHPALSPSGQKIYFASDRAGGYGGMDIWVSTFSGGEWMSPENLGPKINTAGNEVFPFIYEDGTLYFASDGWGGLGGLDIFFSEPINENNQWKDAVNLGKPFNSSKDDFSYILNPLGTEGYFTSARGGGSGLDDIYKFKLPKPQGNKPPNEKVLVNICVKDADSNSKIEVAKVNILTESSNGSFQGFEDDFIVKLIPTEVDGEYAISFKKRDPFGDSGDENKTKTTNSVGYFELEIHPHRNYVFIAQKDNYEETRMEISGEELINANNEICIDMTANLNMECLTFFGKVTNRQYLNTIANASVTLHDLCTGKEVTIMSNSEGKYEFPCVSCGCDFIIRGTKVNFKDDTQLPTTIDENCTESKRIEFNLALTPGFDSNGRALVKFDDNGRPEPTEIFNVKPSERDKVSSENRPEIDLEVGVTMELKNIYYDFDKHYIRTPDADTDLDKLIEFMKRHPDLYVELSSHTDARGSDEYNLELSQNRAKAAMEYVIERGINASRISAQGYGEQHHVNDCEDGVDCTEAQHQMNRRTEVKIIRR